MQFNAFVWGLYKESERGRGVLERLSRFQNAEQGGVFTDPFFSVPEDSDPASN